MEWDFNWLETHDPDYPIHNGDTRDDDEQQHSNRPTNPDSWVGEVDTDGG